jgi:enhancing lycopene biosynthesis protein 2
VKIGVLLCGCGHLDGSEIQEAVLSMLAFQKRGADLVYISLDEKQKILMSHNTKTADKLSYRNMLAESARITRGNILAIEDIEINKLDGLVIPGGSGCAYNFCDFAQKAKNMQVHPKISFLITQMHQQQKPIAAVCIAPVILAKVLAKSNICITIGCDKDIAEIIKSWGANHKTCLRGDCVVDAKNKIVTTPAYMYADSSISEVFAGIDKLSESFFNMLD